MSQEEAEGRGEGDRPRNAACYRGGGDGSDGLTKRRIWAGKREGQVD